MRTGSTFGIVLATGLVAMLTSRAALRSRRRSPDGTWEPGMAKRPPATSIMGSGEQWNANLCKGRLVGVGAWRGWVAQRPEFAARDGVGQGEDVTAEHVDVLEAERRVPRHVLVAHVETLCSDWVIGSLSQLRLAAVTRHRDVRTQLPPAGGVRLNSAATWSMKLRSFAVGRRFGRVSRCSLSAGAA